jgi:Glycosyltransferase WbsX
MPSLKTIGSGARRLNEWTNGSGDPAFSVSHYQPHLPADLGFYDLRLPEDCIIQALLAIIHGLDVFCYWHYWFNGERLLERPFEAVLLIPLENWLSRTSCDRAALALRLGETVDDKSSPLTAAICS